MKRSARIFMCVVTLCMAISLSGCAGIAIPMLDSVDNAVNYTRTKLANINGDHIRGDNPRIPMSVYCYKTLAQVDCFHHPIEGQEDRLVALGTTHTMPYGAIPVSLSHTDKPAVAYDQTWEAAKPKKIMPVPVAKPRNEDEPLNLVDIEIHSERFQPDALPDAERLIELEAAASAQDLEKRENPIWPEARRPSWATYDVDN